MKQSNRHPAVSEGARGEKEMRKRQKSSRKRPFKNAGAPKGARGPAADDPKKESARKRRCIYL
ncbi:hypothetical protein [Desulfoluna spongiiphila]|uniref:hypothetical protein n=1 Tax=Desulfoluna spongiiphila TaxID=419481 RepID=UPI001260005F|nr:hypothetical protein [Desulfoluna spongiiphila]